MGRRRLARFIGGQIKLNGRLFDISTDSLHLNMFSDVAKDNNNDRTDIVQPLLLSTEQKLSPENQLTPAEKVNKYC